MLPVLLVACVYHELSDNLHLPLIFCTPCYETKSLFHFGRPKNFATQIFRSSLLTRHATDTIAHLASQFNTHLLAHTMCHCHRCQTPGERWYKPHNLRLFCLQSSNFLNGSLTHTFFRTGQKKYVQSSRIHKMKRFSGSDHSDWLTRGRPLAVQPASSAISIEGAELICRSLATQQRWKKQDT